MASLIPGFEYDIFIRHRQKDNKYDGWVTDFVDHLKRELEATFKAFVHVFYQVNVKADYARTLKLEADTLVAQSKTKFINPTEVALVYACAGNKERALDMLDRAYDVHDPNLTLLLHPGYDILRYEPRFQELALKLNVPSKLN